MNGGGDDQLNGGNLTTIEAESILNTLRYDNTDANTADEGVRQFSIVLTDTDGLTSTAAVHSVNFNSGAQIGDDTNQFWSSSLAADLIDGRGGVDTVSYVRSNAGVTVDLRDNTQNTGGRATGDVLLNIEKVYGSNHADPLTGDADMPQDAKTELVYVSQYAIKLDDD